MVTDPIANLIIKLKNASDARKERISISHSDLKNNIAHTLLRAGFVQSVESRGKGIEKTLDIGLIYSSNGEPRIHGVRRISKPSRRMYVKSGDIRPLKNGYGNTIISTPKGVFADLEARKHNVGGEVLFTIW